MVLEHTVIVGLRHCIEAVRFLTPNYDPIFSIAVAIERFLRSTGPPLATAMINLIVSSGSGFQISDIIHGTVPLHSFSFDPCSVLLSVVTYVLVQRGIYAEGEYSTKTRTQPK
jgi:hypothetical protein